MKIIVTVAGHTKSLKDANAFALTSQEVRELCGEIVNPVLHTNICSISPDNLPDILNKFKDEIKGYEVYYLI